MPSTHCLCLVVFPVPMCFCGDPCKVAKSNEEDTYRQRYWMCFNFAFEPTLRQRRINKIKELMFVSYDILHDFFVL